MIRAYWLRIVVCGIVGVVLGFLIALLTPKQYEGIVQVMMPPPEPTINQSTPGLESVADLLNFNQSRTVTTQVEALTSFGVAATAAQKVSERYKQPMNMGTEFYPPDVMDRIAITAATGSDVVTLRVRASQPAWARDLAGEMYYAFNEISRGSSKELAQRAITQLEAQQADIDKQIKDLDEKVEAERKATGQSNLELKQQSDYAQQRELEVVVDTAGQELAMGTARVSTLESEIAALPDTIQGSESTNSNPLYQQTKTALMSAKADRDQLISKYYPDFEGVKQLDSRIAGLELQLKEFPAKSIEQKISQKNPNKESLKADLSISKAAVASARDKLQSAQSQLAAKNAEMAKLPEEIKKMTELGRQTVVLEKVQATYKDKLATLKAAKETKQQTTQLITPPQAIDRPVTPNTNLNISLGFVLGIAAGFLWSISTESRRNPVRSLGQLNRLALMPSYRAIPELRVPMRGINRAPADVFDALLVNFIRSEKKGYRLGVLGVNKGAGATTTAMNLAIAAARGGYSVLFVEVDPGNNALTKLAPAAGDIKSPGANISIYNASLGETQAGGTIGLPSDFEVAAQDKDLVIFDFSPVKVSGDAFLIANQLDEIVLLVRANITKSVDFLQAQQALIDAGCPAVTVTLSRVTEQMDDIAALEQQAEIRNQPPDA